MNTIPEPSRETPVVHECDVCVVGGSCTGVFAAVAAARLGSSVAIIEKNGFFGGVATAALVSIWHSLRDTEFDQEIIAGLTKEIADRLAPRNGVILYEDNPHAHCVMHVDELIIELDKLITENNIRPFLHTSFTAPYVEDGIVKAVIIEDKTGRRAIKADMFIDATGDGDLISRIPFETTLLDDPQPPTTCMYISNVKGMEHPVRLIQETVFRPEYRERIPHGFMWGAKVVGDDNAQLVAGTRVPNCNCADADQLTQAEIENRRQIREIMEICREQVPEFKDLNLARIGASIGIRETRHAQCLHTITEQEVLNGVRFDDAIANGSYRVDVHHSDKPGLTFRYLDGREIYAVPGEDNIDSRWREETDEDPVFYQIPYRSLVPRQSKNVLAAGRLMDADRGAYGALRVMVNCNQTGEAAGTAAYIAIQDDVTVNKVDTDKLRTTMSNQGSIII